MAETESETRERTARWVDDQLAGGAKVYYKGWLGDGAHWLADPGGAGRAPAALSSGQLEITDFAEVIRRCGGTTAGLRDLQVDEVTRALDREGWPRVAMSQESARRPMADDDEIADYVDQEAGYDAIAAELPLSTLCQLTLVGENRVAVWESAALHHRHIVDRQWRATLDGDRWRLSGELDAHAVPRFGAALYGALRERRQAGDASDLHVDLGSVSFLDFACAQSLTLTARAGGRDQRLVVHGVTPFVRRIIEVAGRPPSLSFADG